MGKLLFFNCLPIQKGEGSHFGNGSREIGCREGLPHRDALKKGFCFSCTRFGCVFKPGKSFSYLISALVANEKRVLSGDFQENPFLCNVL